MRFRGAGIIFLAAILCGGFAAGVAAQTKISYNPDSQFMFNNNLDAGKGRRGSTDRLDQLWHAESAYVTERGNGNVSLLSHTRYGFRDKWEWHTNLGLDPFRPRIGAKRLWHSLKRMRSAWHFSSNFTACSMYPGLLIAKAAGLEEIVPEERGNSLPITVELGHEFLASRAWSRDPNCSSGQEYLIMTFGVGLYGSFNPSKHNGLPQMKRHFLAQRNTLVMASGRGHLKVWVDGYIRSWLSAHGGAFLMLGNTKPHFFSGELRGEAELFFNSAISLKAGAMISLGRFEGVRPIAGILPMVCVTKYFGKRNADGGIFDANGKMYKENSEAPKSPIRHRYKPTTDQKGKRE